MRQGVKNIFSGPKVTESSPQRWTIKQHT